MIFFNIQMQESCGNILVFIWAFISLMKLWPAANLFYSMCTLAFFLNYFFILFALIVVSFASQLTI